VVLDVLKGGGIDDREENKVNVGHLVRDGPQLRKVALTGSIPQS